MRKLILFALIFIISAGAAFAQNRKLEEKSGYQDIILGKGVEVLGSEKWPIIKPKGESEKVEWFKHTSGKAKRIGNVKLKRITVKTFDNKIMEIVLLFSPADRSDIKTTLTSAFGNPINDQWESENVLLELSDSRVIYLHKPLMSEYNKDRIKIAEQASENL